jgi:hypothetical protein
MARVAGHANRNRLLLFIGRHLAEGGFDLIFFIERTQLLVAGQGACKATVTNDHALAIVLPSELWPEKIGAQRLLPFGGCAAAIDVW